MKQILCFGDSNTWGYNGENGERFPWGVRWTGLLQEKFADVIATGNKGQIMKAVMADLKGKADGKVINQVVAELCK